MYNNKLSKTLMVSGMVSATMLGFSGEVIAAGPAVLDEIVVTAQKRAENLQDVPVAVTAFSSSAVERLMIQDFGDLSVKIPGFSVNSFSKTRVNPSLRGGSSSLNSAGAEQAVGLFIDDVYFGGAGDFNLDLFDVERIEVLRGPQGTLFGRNTTGGLINVVTKDPSVDEDEFKLEAKLGNYALAQIGGLASGRLTDNLAGMISFTARNRKGTSKNTVTGNDVDNINRTAIRAKLLWTPAEDWEVKFALGFSSADETGVARDVVTPVDYVDLDILSDFVPDKDPRTVQMFSDGRYISRQWVGSLHVNKQLDNAQILSISTARTFTADQTPVSLTGVPTELFALADARESDTYTQEFRYISEYEGNFNWVGGVFFYHSDETRKLNAITHWDESVVGGAFSAIFGCPDQTMADFENFAVTPACVTNYPELFDKNEFGIHENVKTTSYSAYAQGTYDISEQLALTLGGRYTYDEKELSGFTSGEYDWFWNPDPGRVVDPTKRNWDKFTWKAVVDWKPTDDILFYFSASTGFRSGAFDMAQSNADLIDKAVNPETVMSYEVGMKARFFEDRVQLNIAAFDAKYENLQFFVNSVASGGVAQTTNAGEASVQGVEVELAFAINSEWTFSAAYSHQEGSSKGIPADAEIPEGTPPQGTIPNTYTVSLDYLKELDNDAEIYFHVDFTHKDEYSLEFIDNSIPQFRSGLDSDLNANLGYRFPNSKWEIQIWGKNLTNENVVLYGQDFWFSLYNGASVGGNAALFNSSFGPRYTAPRTWGATVSYEW